MSSDTHTYGPGSLCGDRSPLKDTRSPHLSYEESAYTHIESDSSSVNDVYMRFPARLSTFTSRISFEHEGQGDSSTFELPSSPAKLDYEYANRAHQFCMPLQRSPVSHVTTSSQSPASPVQSSDVHIRGDIPSSSTPYLSSDSGSSSDTGTLSGSVSKHSPSVRFSTLGKLDEILNAIAMDHSKKFPRSESPASSTLRSVTTIDPAILTLHRPHDYDLSSSDSVPLVYSVDNHKRANDTSVASSSLETVAYRPGKILVKRKRSLPHSEGDTASIEDIRSASNSHEEDEEEGLDDDGNSSDESELDDDKEDEIKTEYESPEPPSKKPKISRSVATESSFMYRAHEPASLRRARSLNSSLDSSSFHSVPTVPASPASPSKSHVHSQFPVIAPPPYPSADISPLPCTPADGARLWAVETQVHSI